MNDQGLVVAVAATPLSGSFTSPKQPVGWSFALDRVLANCASVKEAIAWWEQHPNIRINCTVATPTFFGTRYSSTFVNRGVGGHVLMADKSGESVVYDLVGGDLEVYSRGRFENFRGVNQAQ